MRGFPDRQEPEKGEPGSRRRESGVHALASVRARRREVRARERVRIGSWDGLDGHAGAIVRPILAEIVARLERAEVALGQGKSVARTIVPGLDKPATATDPALARAPLEALLDELSLALGALGQAAGSVAAQGARATAARLARGRGRAKGKTATDPELTRDLDELGAGRLPDGFKTLAVVRALLA